ncbi:unnamed protein product [Lota lota]
MGPFGGLCSNRSGDRSPRRPSCAATVEAQAEATEGLFHPKGPRAHSTMDCLKHFLTQSEAPPPAVAGSFLARWSTPFHSPRASSLAHSPLVTGERTTTSSDGGCCCRSTHWSTGRRSASSSWCRLHPEVSTSLRSQQTLDSTSTAERPYSWLHSSFNTALPPLTVAAVILTAGASGESVCISMPLPCAPH